ncbi:hypothetical protein [Pseudarthrobacter sp. NPDC058119]
MTSRTDPSPGAASRADAPAVALAIAIFQLPRMPFLAKFGPVLAPEA